MIDTARLYTRDEFKTLLGTDHTIGYYNRPLEEELFEYYVCNNKTLTDEEIALFEDNKLGFYNILNIDKLGDIEYEASQRLWFDRSAVGTEDEPKDMPEEFRNKILAKQAEVIKQFDIDPEECDDFYHGYWSGILAMCRYLNYGKDADLDDLRSGNGLLDS